MSDAHSSFIKTPKQLIAIVVAAFVVPVAAIVLIIELVTGEQTPNRDVMTPEAVAERLQPVARVEFGPVMGTPQAAAAAPSAAPAAAAPKTGEEVVKAVCSACHGTGAAGAPKIGDKAAWAPRIKQGLPTLLNAALHGLRAMPPKGGDPSLSEEEIRRAIIYMTDKSGANFKEPPAPAKPAAAPASASASGKVQVASLAEGKKVFETVCTVCHTPGLAGAPKFGNKADWAPRIKQGMSTLYNAALHGLRAMPPKGGNPSLSDAQVRAAVNYMVSKSK